MAKLLSYILITIFLSISSTGCAPPTIPPPPSVAEATERFLESCKKEYNYDVIAKIFPRSVWIYYPFKENLAVGSPAEQKTKYIVQYHDGKFSDGTFNIEYDIIQRKKETDFPTLKYTEKFLEIQRNITTLTSNAFLATGKPPEGINFFFITLADITNGVETKMIFNYEDSINYQAGFLPPDEYTKRLIGKFEAHPSVTGDLQGSHLNFHDIDWQEFVTLQILHRIFFKFNQSDFPPSDDVEQEILDIISETTKYYKFSNFKSVRLKNLRTEREYVYKKSQSNELEQ